MIGASEWRGEGRCFAAQKRSYHYTSWCSCRLEWGHESPHECACGEQWEEINDQEDTDERRDTRQASDRRP